MKKVIVIVGAILCSLVFVFAESRSITSAVPSVGPGSEAASGPGAKDDHDDKGPIQVGYAIITPTANTSGAANMVVFETFGLREAGPGGATQAGVLPPGLTTNALLFVDSDTSLQKNLGVAIVNPNASNANVTLTLRGSDGAVLNNPPLVVNVASHQQISKFVTELFANQQSVPKSLTGTLTVTTDTSTPVSVIGLRFRGANFSTLPITNLTPSNVTISSYANGVGGTNAVLLPQFAAGGGWATEVVIVNNDSAKITVRVDLFKQDGSALSTALNGQAPTSSFMTIDVPAHGVHVLAPRDNNGKDDF